MLLLRMTVANLAVPSYGLLRFLYFIKPDTMFIVLPSRLRQITFTIEFDGKSVRKKKSVQLTEGKEDFKEGAHQLGKNWFNGSTDE